MTKFKLLLLITILSLMYGEAFAQFSQRPQEDVEIELTQFHVIGHETVHFDGQPFTEITFEKKPEFLFQGTTDEEWLLQANMAVDMGVAWRLMHATWDKEMHFLIGYELGNISNGVFQLILPKDMKHKKLVSALLGFGVSAFAGAAKEYYDYKNPRNHTADVNDFLATAAGGAFGTLTLTFDLRKALYGKY
jgi:hypothetical protein